MNLENLSKEDAADVAHTINRTNVALDLVAVLMRHGIAAATAELFGGGDWQKFESLAGRVKPSKPAMRAMAIQLLKRIEQGTPAPSVEKAQEVAHA